MIHDKEIQNNFTGIPEVMAANICHLQQSQIKLNQGIWLDQYRLNVGSMLAQRLRRWASIGPALRQPAYLLSDTVPISGAISVSMTTRMRWDKVTAESCHCVSPTLGYSM